MAISINLVRHCGLDPQSQNLMLFEIPRQARNDGYQKKPDKYKFYFSDIVPHLNIKRHNFLFEFLRNSIIG